jgi:hypothetical protein
LGGKKPTFPCTIAKRGGRGKHGGRGREHVRRRRTSDVLADRVERTYLDLREHGVPDPSEGAAAP